MQLVGSASSRSLSSRLRRRRVGVLVSLVEDVLRRDALGRLTIVDLGGTEVYWRTFPFARFADVRFSITLVNTDLTGDPALDLPPNVTFERHSGDVCSLPSFPSGGWDIAHSNSVIEHVGGWQRMKAMAGEVHRLGRAHYVQTPNYSFPVEPHHLIPAYQFLPRSLRILMLRAKGDSLERAITNDERIRLLTRAELRLLFPNSLIMTERFLGLPKSFLVRSRVT